MTFDEWMKEAERLAMDFAHVYSFVGDDTMPRAKFALLSHLRSRPVDGIDTSPGRVDESGERGQEARIEELEMRCAIYREAVEKVHGRAWNLLHQEYIQHIGEALLGDLDPAWQLREQS